MKRKIVIVSLTDEQRATLEPLFAAARKANAKLEDVAIFAQVWRDGIVATICSADEVHGVRALLKADGWRRFSTAEERVTDA